MSSLRELYSDALLDHYGYPQGWMVSWPLGHERKLGMVGTISRDADDVDTFAPSGVMADYGVDWPVDPDAGSKSGPWEFTSHESINVQFGVDASSPLWSFIGDAKAGLRVGFEDRGGLVLTVAGSANRRLPDLDGLRKKLLEVAKAGQMSVGHAVVIELDRADASLLVASIGGAGMVEASTNFDVAKAGLSLASFASDVKVNNQSGAAVCKSMPDGHVLAFRVVQLRSRGWWFWRRVDVMGAEDVSEEQEEIFIDDDEYFVLADD